MDFVLCRKSKKLICTPNITITKLRNQRFDSGESNTGNTASRMLDEKRNDERENTIRSERKEVTGLSIRGIIIGESLISPLSALCQLICKSSAY